MFISEPTPKTDSAATDLLWLCVPAQFAYITVARNAAGMVSEQLGMSLDSQSAVKLAVGEACNNAVQYGSSSENRRFFVACRTLTNTLEIDVISEDSGFYPHLGTHFMPAAEELAEHGRGLALIELLMDAVEYLSSDGAFRVRLQKKI